ncbi:ABC transporter permease [Mangrovihabitans endophyticus]|uniref:Transport permease protein n=1 Tax=Mangrovihabitans endophyticus TaxID=1751298 RepID=A0A8J3C2N1_9ACTN|nr:ABC transporter permease [Mangrovihabitans endophyticus]GGL09842.1 transport permease protein [Mangrovihabitans endophyticus]
MGLFAKITRNELRLFLREPLVAFFSLAFPTILVVILGSIPEFREPSEALGGVTVISLYVGIALALGLAMLGLQFMPTVLASYRERGVLRRVAVTPVRPVTLLGAQLAATLVMALVSGILVLAVGKIAFDVNLPGQPVGFLIAYLLCGAGVFAVGLLVAALAPSGKAGNAIGTLLFFPSMFFAGLWTPREVLPAVLQRIGDFTPLGAGERALHDAAVGQWPALLPLAVLLAYVVVFGAAAARLFRWE